MKLNKFNPDSALCDSLPKVQKLLRIKLEINADSIAINGATNSEFHNIL